MLQRVIPMLPPLLCEELCSLNPGVDRLAFSVVWRMHGNGELDPSSSPWFGRSVIRSVAKLDYGTAQVGARFRLRTKTASTLLSHPRIYSQNCMDGTVTHDMAAAADAGSPGSIPDALWPESRRPRGGGPGAEGGRTVSCEGVWTDLRMMHRIAMARRRKRFQAGALSLNKVRGPAPVRLPRLVYQSLLPIVAQVKLAFRLDADGNPLGLASYPVRDR